MWNIANMYAAGQIGKADPFMECVWTFRAKKLAAPAERQLLAYAARAMSRYERSLLSEQFVACKQQGDAWAPQGPTVKLDARNSAQ